MIHTICYDKTGYIYFNQAGDIKKPAGIENMFEVEVPNGQYVEKVDLSGDEPKAILKEFQKSEIQILKEENEELKKSVKSLIFEEIPAIYDIICGSDE